MGEGSGIPIGRGLVIALLATLAAAGLQRTALVEHVDLFAFDRLAPMLAAPADDRVVVVEIDQQSLEQHGRWPWSRTLHATLIDRLAAAGPKVIAYDVLFAEPSSREPEADLALVSAVRRAGNVVLPVIAELRARHLPPLEQLPFGDLSEAAAALGHGHLNVDSDGRLRRLQLRAGIGEAYWPAMASAVYGLAIGAPTTPLHQLTPGAEPLRLGWIADHEVLVPIPAGPFNLRFYSAADMLHEPVQHAMDGAIVLVGVTARGLATWVDAGSSAVAKLIPPIYFQAFAVQALLNEKTLSIASSPVIAAAALAFGAFLPWLVSLFAAPDRARINFFLAPLMPLGIGLVALLGWRLMLPFASVIVLLTVVVLGLRMLEVVERLRQAQLERGLAHAALTNVVDAVLTTGPTQVVDYANPAADRLFASSGRALVGQRLDDIAPELAELVTTERREVAERTAGKAGGRIGAQSSVAALLTKPGAPQALPLATADGRQRIVKAAVRRLGGARHSGYVIALNDVTDEQRLLDEVAFRATHDGLTKLPNRHLLIDRLANAIERGRRDQRLLAVAFLDVDRLKSINDALGHAVGDSVLVELAHRLRAAGRATDTLARIGGDEFVLLLENLASRDEVETAIARYRKVLALPVLVDGRQFEVKVSFGVACFPNDGTAPDDLLRRADTAMYRAKAGGRDQVVFYDADLHGEESGGLLLDAALRQGIEREELELHYQPRIDLGQGHPAGLESLVRWRHPEQGFLQPGRFIGLAEETGSIVELGRWVLARACADLAESDLRRTDLRLSINVSVVQLKRDEGLVDFIRSLLIRHDLAPDRLELEVTESLFLDPSLPMLGRRLAALAELGMHLSIDDFGTGYSSLAYINRFPFDRIKIDRSFVHAISEDKSAQAIVRAIVGLSEALAKKTTAEGVEQRSQLDFLYQLNCNEAQGFLFGRPVPLADLLPGLPGLIAGRPAS